MSDRFCLRTLLFFGLLLPFVGCNNSQVNSIIVTPGNQSLTAGQTVQYTATALVGHAGHPPQNITNSVTWSSNDASVATINASGLAKAVSAGTAIISASTTGFGGGVSASASLTVTGGGGGTQTLVSLAIIPGSQSVASPGQTTQFLAIGTTSSGATEDKTSQVTWSSSSVQVAKISSGGLATGLSQGTTTITAIATNLDNSVVTGTATFTVTNGTSEPFTALSISPGGLSLSATGQSGQFLALGTSGSTGLAQDVTNFATVTWTSSIPTIATVSTYPAAPAGVAAGVSAGSTTITVKLTNPDGSVLTAAATVTVSATAAPEPLLSVVVLPSSLTVNNLLGTGQYLAYGTFSTAPTVMDITNGIDHNGFKSPVTWVSTSQLVFPITSSGAGGATGGLVTATGAGADDIYAVATNPDGTVVYSPPVTFNCPYVAYVPATSTSPAVLGSCNDHTVSSGLLVTLTVFNAGLNTKDWLITAPSATGTPDVIHCGAGSASGGSVCVATYPLGSTITLTAPAGTGAFGGWSWNCVPTVAVTAAGPNSCTVTVGTGNSSNESVGAIFN